MKYLLLVIMLLCPVLLFALEVPQLSGRIVDRAGLLSTAARENLDRRLAAFEGETSNQVAVLTVSSLEGDDIDSFSIRVAETWKLGQKGRDNGVLLVIARQERKVRIEVGMGLQGVLPDITSARIIRDVMRPYLKTGDFDHGVSVAVDSIIAATKGEFKGTAAGGARGEKHRNSKSSPSFFVILVAAIVVTVFAGLFSRYLGGAAGAVAAPLSMYLVFPAVTLLTLILLAVAGLFAGMLLSMYLAGFNNGGSGGGFGGWWGGGFYGGGGGSSGGSDSFDGGGGGFDGGGSSDDF